jgi:hypothetical protein
MNESEILKLEQYPNCEHKAVPRFDPVEKRWYCFYCHESVPAPATGDSSAPILEPALVNA